MHSAAHQHTNSQSNLRQAEIRSSNPATPSLLEIASRYTELTPRGRRLLGLCPLHSEKTPSFTVDTEKNLFYCFGCGIGGDAITLLQKMEGLSFKDAAHHLGITDTGNKKSSKHLLAKEAAKAIRVWSRQLSDRIAARLRVIGQESVFLRDQMVALPYTDPFLRAEMLRLARIWDVLTVFQEDLEEAGDTFPIPTNQKEARDQRAKRLLECWKERKMIETVLSRELENPTDNPDSVWPALTQEYKDQVRSYV